MTKPVWPSATLGHVIKENSRTELNDGYSFVTVVATQAANGVEILWRTEGKVTVKPWGELQVLRMSASNLPPHVALSDLPRKTERNLRERPLEGGREGSKYEVEIKETTTFADGSVASTTDWCESELSLAEIRSIPHNTVQDDLKNVYEKNDAGRYAALRPARRSRPTRRGPMS